MDGARGVVVARVDGRRTAKIGGRVEARAPRVRVVGSGAGTAAAQGVAQRILKDNPLVVALTVTLGLDTVVADGAALITLDASLSACCLVGRWWRQERKSQTVPFVPEAAGTQKQERTLRRDKLTQTAGLRTLLYILLRGRSILAIIVVGRGGRALVGFGQAVNVGSAGTTRQHLRGRGHCIGKAVAVLSV